MKLNKVFGIGQWCLLKREVKLDETANKCYYVGILLIRGCYVSEAIGEAEYHKANTMQSWASVAESAKSDCIVRCCKDLGIASELWQPQFSRKWVEEYAVKVFVEVERQGTKKRTVQWRRKDVKPFWNEVGIVGQSNGNQAAQPATPGNSNQQAANPPAANTPKGKTAISENQYKKACDRLKKGEHDVYNQVLEAFSLTNPQKNELAKLYNSALNMQQNKAQ